MTGNKLIAVIASMMAVGAALAVAGLYVDWGRISGSPEAERGPVAATGDATAPAGSQTVSPSGEPQQPPPEATGALTPPSEPTSVPTFDVVVIEPSGEGVIAGRAAPGWNVSVQSGGTNVAEAKVDIQGEWSVVLEKPLPAGDHALSLKITSPDGTRAVTSQETVRVAVGTEAKASAPATAVEAPKPADLTPQAGAPDAANVSPQLLPQVDAAPPLVAEPEGTRALARSEQAIPSASPVGAPKPKLVFRTVDYEDKGPGTGTVTITGTSEPGATIAIYYGNERIAEARADRQGYWRAAVAKKLGMGQHSFRAEQASAASGMARTAMVSIERAEPKPQPAPATLAAKGAPQIATTNGRVPTAMSKDVYTVQRGDTLWAIAKRYLGSGLRYPAIFQDNRTKIDNPNLIHPQQEVTVPQP